MNVTYANDAGLPRTVEALGIAKDADGRPYAVRTATRLIPWHRVFEVELDRSKEEA